MPGKLTWKLCAASALQAQEGRLGVKMCAHHVDDGEEEQAQVGLAVLGAGGVQRGAQEERCDDRRHHAHLCEGNPTPAQTTFTEDCSRTSE